MCTDELKSSTMIYQFEGLDLDTGTVHTTFFPMEFDPDVDVFFEYNSRTPVHLRVFPTNEAKMAILRGVAFEDVNCIHAHTAIFTGLPKELDEPIKSGDTVILRTAEGGIFKMGNALEHDDVIVDFDWAELCVSCG
jgi:hypothetical protein